MRIDLDSKWSGEKKNWSGKNQAILKMFTGHQFFIKRIYTFWKLLTLKGLIFLLIL